MFVLFKVPMDEVPIVKNILNEKSHIEWGGGTSTTDWAFFIRSDQKEELKEICQKQDVHLNFLTT